MNRILSLESPVQFLSLLSRVDEIAASCFLSVMMFITGFFFFFFDGLVVSKAAIQAVDPGSILDQQKSFLFSFFLFFFFRCKAEMFPSCTSLIRKLKNFPKALTVTIFSLLC